MSTYKSESRLLRVLSNQCRVKERVEWLVSKSTQR